MILFRIAPYLGIYLLVVIAWTLWRLERVRRQIEREARQRWKPDDAVARTVAHWDRVARKERQMQKSERAIRESRIMAGTHRGSTR